VKVQKNSSSKSLRTFKSKFEKVLIKVWESSNQSFKIRENLVRVWERFKWTFEKEQVGVDRVQVEFWKSSSRGFKKFKSKFEKLESKYKKVQFELWESSNQIKKKFSSKLEKVRIRICKNSWNQNQKKFVKVWKSLG
jgi:hypothetical protein